MVGEGRVGGLEVWVESKNHGDRELQGAGGEDRRYWLKQRTGRAMGEKPFPQAGKYRVQRITMGVTG